MRIDAVGIVYGPTLVTFYVGFDPTALLKAINPLRLYDLHVFK